MPEPRPFSVLTTALAGAAVAIPILVGMGLPQMPALGRLDPPFSGGTRFSPAKLSFERRPVGKSRDVPPWTTNSQIVDVDGDGLSEVLVCDARFGSVLACRLTKAGEWKEEILGTDLVAPAHATVVDFDGDGDRDVVVSVLGDLWPNDDVIGRVVLLEKTANGYVPRDLLTHVRRVADVQPGDFDADGDVDLAVAVFGYARGEVLWLENHGGKTLEPHTLLSAAGAIHVPVADYDGDGDLDIATTISQDDEEVWGFENIGKGRFQRRRPWSSPNHDLGSAGLVRADLDRDGDPDLILPVGDNLEDAHSYPQPYHGCLWLENRGRWTFAAKRIATLGGTYAADVGDLDGDGDLDVALASLLNGEFHPPLPSLVWLENDGRQNFTPWSIAGKPAQLVTVGCGDLNGDGRADLVAGGLNVAAPFENGPVASVWLSGGREGEVKTPSNGTPGR